MFVYRLIPTVLFLLAIAGCKIEISVPEGGKVEGYTLYGCGEGQFCTISVNHLWFIDTFEAIPNEDHRFTGWRTGPKYFCGGSKAHCALRTFGLAGAKLEAFLFDDEETFFLEPVFEPKYAGYQKRLNADLLVTVLYKQVNYPVDGTDFDSWSDDVQSNVNPIGRRNSEGKKYMGNFHYDQDKGHYWYRFENGYCRITRYEKNYNHTITLPAPYFPSEKVSNEADEYYWDIVYHEGAHSRIRRWLIERRHELVNSLFEPFYKSEVDDVNSCGAAIFEELRKINTKTSEKYYYETDEFHSIDTGAYWGRCEQPNRFMKAYCPEGMM